MVHGVMAFSLNVVVPIDMVQCVRSVDERSATWPGWVAVVGPDGNNA
jgi:hypothetical protein